MSKKIDTSKDVSYDDIINRFKQLAKDLNKQYKGISVRILGNKIYFQFSTPNKNRTVYASDLVLNHQSLALMFDYAAKIKAKLSTHTSENEFSQWYVEEIEGKRLDIPIDDRITFKDAINRCY